MTMINSRPYKQRYAYAAITGTEPEYVDCKAAVAENPEKYTYTKTDYPCAVERELAAYTELNTDSQISSCYKQIIEHKITHASKHTKIKLPDGALLLKIPGYIDNPGRMTGYNVNKDCSITVTTINTANGFILGMQSMSRGQFNSKYKIDDTPKPAPEAEKEEGGGLGELPSLDELTEHPLFIPGAVVAGLAVAAMIFLGMRR